MVKISTTVKPTSAFDTITGANPTPNDLVVKDIRAWFYLSDLENLS